MKIVPVDEKTVLGISVRTKNADEMQPQTAKIGELWQQFYQDIAPKLQNGATIYVIPPFLTARMSRGLTRF
jgi:predicted transcriptional regulator YdeE